MASLKELVMTAIKSLFRGKSFLQAFFAFWVAPAVIPAQDGDSSTGTLPKISRRSIDDFLREAERMLLAQTEGEGLREFTRKLKLQFREALRSNPQCMLPSYNHQLPTGCEKGQYLALDVGGSTLRVALVELKSRGAQGGESRIVRMDSFKINPTVKKLEGMAFFDWMAQRIVETISSALEKDERSKTPLLVGLAWSFPIEYVIVLARMRHRC
jgi:hexokinase